MSRLTWQQSSPFIIFHKTKNNLWLIKLPSIYYHDILVCLSRHWFRLPLFLFLYRFCYITILVTAFCCFYVKSYFQYKIIIYLNSFSVKIENNLQLSKQYYMLISLTFLWATKNVTKSSHLENLSCILPFI